MNVDKRRDLVLDVIFTIDMNGLLEVTAEDPVTKQRASVSITSDKLNLTDREIQQMAKQFKTEQLDYAKAYAKANPKEETGLQQFNRIRASQGNGNQAGC